MAEKRKPGRPKGKPFGERFTIRAPSGTTDRIDALLYPSQGQGEFLREAILARIDWLEATKVSE